MGSSVAKTGPAKRRRIRCWGLVLALTLPGVCTAETRMGLGLEGGWSPQRDAGAARLLAFGDLGDPLRPLGGWTLQHFLEFAVSRLQAEDGGDILYGTGLRLGARNSLAGLPRLFLEFGVGPVLLSEEKLGPTDLGSNLQFRSHVGLGGYLDAPHRLSLGYRFTHTSNAGLGDANPGINFHAVRFGFRF